MNQNEFEIFNLEISTTLLDTVLICFLTLFKLSIRCLTFELQRKIIFSRVGSVLSNIKINYRHLILLF
jgi:hypothetical protein